jgi:hypothetical protein
MSDYKTSSSRGKVRAREFELRLPIQIYETVVAAADPTPTVGDNCPS